MSTVVRACKLWIWMILAAITLFQVCTVAAICIDNAARQAAGEKVLSYPIAGLLCALALMIAGVVLFMAWKKARYWGLIVSAAAGILFILVALELYRTDTPLVDNTVNMVKMVGFHMSPVLIPLLMLPAWLGERPRKKKNGPAGRTIPLRESSIFVHGEDQEEAPLSKEQTSGGKEPR